MPVYEYLCDKCGKVTESLRKMDQADSAIPCGHCGSPKTHRTHSVFAASIDHAGATGGAEHQCRSGQCCGGGQCSSMMN